MSFVAIAIGATAIGVGLEAYQSASAPDYAGMLAGQEAQRQKLINQGLTSINDIFSGGPTFNLASGAYNPKQQYFKAPQSQVGSGPFYGLEQDAWSAPPPTAPIGNRPKPNAQGGNSSLGSTAGKPPNYVPIGPPNYRNAQQQYANLLGQNRLFVQGPNTPGFNQNFYNQAAQAYVDYATPQLAKQYSDTQKSILYGLGNRGLSNSGAANQALSDLNLTLGQQQQGITDTGIQQAQQLQRNVEQARANAVSQLYQTANPAQATAQAVSSAAQYSAPQVFQPLSNAFSGLANQYAQNLLYSYTAPSSLYSQQPTGNYGPQIPVAYG